MIAVFAAVKGDDGRIRAEKFLLVEAEADELLSDASGTYARPWVWMVAESTSLAEEEERDDAYAAWWWNEWERRRAERIQKNNKLPKENP